MSSLVITKSYASPPINKEEILRYAGCKETSAATDFLLDECIAEIKEKLCYKVCYITTTVRIDEDTLDFSFFKVMSKNLATNLKGCKKAVIFTATIGVEADRLISKYGYLSPSKALMLDAIGDERVEALCDTFVKDIQTQTSSCLKPRFSAGYGDLPISVQKDIFAILQPLKNIGVAINDSMLLSPSKSVTAFVGIVD